ncbi:hypothetical protein EXIGLDRAFT_725634 [Exidia glandulosa HHB12029]|uniref:Mid2 domain-containing protein n=1 Tax=Exidia glandulosa HHB12029 TaxID=1314781 RepID=A0A166BQC8_EXIGL|nr:hypothetical protein EXIGLDRAFT_725634 [Exidia glandulosa HHB12029]
MRTKSIVTHWLAPYAVLSVVHGAVQLGHEGADLLMSAPVACEPLRIFYNISSAGASDTTIVFLTPDARQDEWMELRAPVGLGILSWTCPLNAGSQFVVRNFRNFEQLFTVEQAAAGGDCHQDRDLSNPPRVTTTFAYGSMDADVYHSFTAASYSPTTISPGNVFHPTDIPGGDFGTIPVPLGLRMGDASPFSSTPFPSVPQTSAVSPNPTSQHSEGTHTSDIFGSGDTRTNADGVATNSAADPGPAILATVSMPTTAVPGRESGTSTASPQTPFSRPSFSQGAHGRVTPAIGALVGIALGATAFGASCLAACIFLFRRYKRIRRDTDTIRPMPPLPAASNTCGKEAAVPPAYSDSKVALTKGDGSDVAQLPSSSLSTDSLISNSTVYTDSAGDDTQSTFLYSPPVYSA